MRFKLPSYLVAGLVAATLVSACVGKYKSDFSVVVVNRAVNAIQVLANGNELGQVAAGQTGSFKIVLAESNLNEFTNGVAPTPQGQVTLAAKDLKTGVLSTVQNLTLSQSAPVYVTFSAADFPATAPPVARITFSPNAPAPNQDVAFSGASSTVTGGTFAWDFGDGGTGSGVTITHQFPRAATFTVILRVTNDTGQTATATTTVNVSTTLQANAAAFTFSPTTPGVNQDVFFNASTSTVSGTFTWDFGDGTTGAGVTVTHKFARAGTYAVNLRVTNVVGQSGATSRPVSVSATSPTVVANFTFSPTTPGINQNVFFNASASTPSNATYAWNFGDGSTGSGGTPTHAYAQAGTYGVSLTVSNDIGQSSTTSRTITVSATGPPGAIAAIFAFSPTVPGVNQEVFFDAAASRPPDGTFTWDFGDGARGSGVTPTHRFAQAGQYRVTMTVANAFGQSATTTQIVTVLATSPQVIASFTFSPTAPAINQEVFFNASASIPSTGTFTWNFGDGSPIGSGVAPTHQFTQAGTYTVSMTVTNNNGQASTATRTVPVSATSAGVVARFTFSPTSPSVNQEVLFNASASTPSNGTFSWNFGDGSPTGSGVTPTRRYTQAGTYTVTLTVTNSNGQSSTTSTPVTVSASAPTASFSFSPSSPTAGQTVFFNGSASTSAAGTTITSYVWDFGDGTSGTGGTTTKTYASAGTFVARLTVSDSSGQTGTTTQTVTVAAVTGPTATFSFSPASPTTGQTVFFNGSASTSATGTTITSYAWDFGDGTAGTGVSTTRAFAIAGTFVVRLTVTDSNARTGTTTQSVTVTAPASPTASFSFSPTAPVAGQTVSFNGSASTAATGTTITSYAWDFGNGSTGTGVTANHAFANAGTFLVRLTVTDTNGRTGATTQSVTVSLVADFTFSPTDPKVATTIFFDATPSSASVTTWTWDFGDGTSATTQKPSKAYASTGTRVVRLTVGDAAGRTATTTKNVAVTP